VSATSCDVAQEVADKSAQLCNDAGQWLQAWLIQVNKQLRSDEIMLMEYLEFSF